MTLHYQLTGSIRLPVKCTFHPIPDTTVELMVTSVTILTSHVI